MLLKKQTVWLLTMLSLVAVLSVYYITSPVEDELAYTEQDVAQENEMQQTEDMATIGESNGTVEQAEDGSVTSSLATNDFFMTARMQYEDSRSRIQENLTSIMASTNLPTDKINEASEKLQDLTYIMEKEKIIETLIKSELGFSEALVYAEDNHVKVTVQSEQLSAKEANDIMHMVRQEIKGINDVYVSFLPPVSE
ncbi:SpoIIIAH-like family protein [Bacillus salinus]|uniref:SpoIIIAH-like family protein n=1 Tax=Bacillus sp. HMF5848 TaxID=2495421 RepID=UPI001639EA02|nr:SpoIIIAH-like family protein [Bacillus sp. HMF5848]